MAQLYRAMVCVEKKKHASRVEVSGVAVSVIKEEQREGKGLQHSSEISPLL